MASVFPFIHSISPSPRQHGQDGYSRKARSWKLHESSTPAIIAQGVSSSGEIRRPSMRTQLYLFIAKECGHAERIQRRRSSDLQLWASNAGKPKMPKNHHLFSFFSFLSALLTVLQQVFEALLQALLRALLQELVQVSRHTSRKRWRRLTSTVGFLWAVQSVYLIVCIYWWMHDTECVPLL